MNRRKNPRNRRQRRDRRTKSPAGGFRDVFQNVVLASSAGGVIFGQAEMLGEPWRHVLAVGGVVILLGVAVWMKRT